jgi:hypothetical protein
MALHYSTTIILKELSLKPGASPINRKFHGADVLVATSLAVEPSPAISENGTRKES